MSASAPTSDSCADGDAQLVRDALAGQVHAFGKLVERNQRLARAIAFSVSNDYNVAQDLAQEAFVSAWLRLADLHDPYKFRSWLAGIVRNTASYWRRHQGRHAPPALFGLEVLQQLPSETQSPLETALYKESLHHIQDALAGLAPQDKEALLLYYSLDESHAALAQALGLSEATTRQRVCRAKKRLKHSVADVERTCTRLHAQTGAAAAVLLLISTQEAAQASAAQASAAQANAASSPKLFIALGALTGTGLLVSVAALAMLLTQDHQAHAHTPDSSMPLKAALPGRAEQIGPPQALDTSPQALIPKQAAVSAEQGVVHGRVRVGSGRVHDDAKRSSLPSSALPTSRKSEQAVGTSGKGRIHKHGPARLINHQEKPRPLLRPSLDLNAVQRDLWNNE